MATKAKDLYISYTYYYLIVLILRDINLIKGDKMKNKTTNEEGSRNYSTNIGTVDSLTPERRMQLSVERIKQYLPQILEQNRRELMVEFPELNELYKQPEQE